MLTQTFSLSSLGAILVQLPLDQIFFIFAQLFAFCYAFIFRRKLIDSLQSGSGTVSGANNSNSSGSSSNNQLYIALFVPGLFFTYLCFGIQTVHLINLTTISYLLILYVSARWIHVTLLAVSMAYLSYLHVDRLVNEYHVTVDITAPMMILVQKITIVGFGLYDGFRYDELSPEQKTFAIRKRPSFLEFSAYTFNFQTVICGPLVFYTDFVEYLNGNKLKKYNLTQYPSVTNALLRKLFVCLVCSILILKFAPLYPASLMIEPEFGKKSFVIKLFILYVVAFAARLKYYFAWSISELVCNASGLGFNGLDVKQSQIDGVPVGQWNLLTNIDIINFENALCQRDALQCWNITTEKWLRKVAYERAPAKLKLLWTYVLSAFWHGFHPGYYLTFLSGALFTMAARTVRRCLRHRFKALGSGAFAFYHAMTWLTTRVAMSYLVFPFVILNFNDSVTIYRHFYYFGHIVAVVFIVLLPLVFVPEPNTGNQSTKSIATKASPKTTRTPNIKSITTNQTSQPTGMNDGKPNRANSTLNYKVKDY